MPSITKLKTFGRPLRVLPNHRTRIYYGLHRQMFLDPVLAIQARLMTVGGFDHQFKQYLYKAINHPV